MRNFMRECQKKTIIVNFITYLIQKSVFTSLKKYTNWAKLINSAYTYKFQLKTTQDEKPYYEMNPIDIQIKDFLSSWIYFLYYNGFLQFIALFTPPITFGIVYPISQLNVFLIHFAASSYFVFLYLQYRYIFNFDEMKFISKSRLRWNCFACKLLLTCFSICVSIGYPLEKQPVIFQMLTKGKTYDR